jgi:hypothetical protein
MLHDSATLVTMQTIIVVVLMGLWGMLMLASDSSTLDLPLNWSPTTIVVGRHCGCSAQLKRTEKWGWEGGLEGI